MAPLLQALINNIIWIKRPSHSSEAVRTREEESYEAFIFKQSDLLKSAQEFNQEEPS